MYVTLTEKSMTTNSTTGEVTEVLSWAARSLEVASEEEVEAASAAAILEEEASEAEVPEANSNHNQLLYNDVQQHFWKYLPSHQFR